MREQHGIAKNNYKIVRPTDGTNKEYLKHVLEKQSWENIIGILLYKLASGFWKFLR